MLWFQSFQLGKKVLSVDVQCSDVVGAFSFELGDQFASGVVAVSKDMMPGAE